MLQIFLPTQIDQEKGHGKKAKSATRRRDGDRTPQPAPPSIIRYVVETRSTVGFEQDLRSLFMGTIEP
jgi:hypothetical protein